MKEKGGKYKSYLKGINDLLSPTDVKKIIVIDISSNYVRVGLSGENFPLLNLPFLVAKSRSINSTDLTQTKLPDLFAAKGINGTIEKPQDYSIYYPLMSSSAESYHEEFSKIFQRENGQDLIFQKKTLKGNSEKPIDSMKESDGFGSDYLIQEDQETKTSAPNRIEPSNYKLSALPDNKNQNQIKIKKTESPVYSQENWNDIECCIKYIFEEVLQLETANLEIMFVDSIGQNKEFRQKISEVFFENLRVQSINFMNSAVCSLFSSGKTDGVAVEFGHSSTNVIPIFGGIVLNHALHMSNYGGREATKIMKHFLMENGYDFASTSGDFNSTIEMIKEKLSYCSMNYEEDVANPNKLEIEESCIELPDGSIIEINRETKYSTGEVLLRPSRGFWSSLPSIRDNEMDIVSKIYHSIDSCEMDMKKKFAKNILICGGASKTNNLVKRLKRDYFASLPQSLSNLEHGINVETNVPFSSWIGGSILGSITTFQNLKIKKIEWDEAGEFKSSLMLKRLIA